MVPANPEVLPGVRNGGEVGMIEIDMRMPEKCGLCPCLHFENPIYCQAVKANKNKKIGNPYAAPRPEWCPLKEQDPVRCKNCAYAFIKEGVVQQGHIVCTKPYTERWQVTKPDDWFCADWKRREGIAQTVEIETTIH